MQLTSKKTPQTGLEGKFSIYHAASAALIEGAGGLDQFSDRAVNDQVIASLRDRVSAAVDPALHEDQVRIVVVTKDGKRLQRYVEHALGSADHPMADEALEAKFNGLAAGKLPADRIRGLIDLCWNIAAEADAGSLARAATV
jgi:2-methylcitrate dehydratase PrpD